MRSQAAGIVVLFIPNAVLSGVFRAEAAEIGISGARRRLEAQKKRGWPTAKFLLEYPIILYVKFE